eukprot:4631927-Amphidinium_carterae.6
MPFLVRRHGQTVLEALLAKLGASVDEIDVSNAQEHDLVDQENWTKLWRMVDFHAVLLAPPCSTVSRYDHGPQPLRGLRGHEGRARYGLADLTIAKSAKRLRPTHSWR